MVALLRTRATATRATGGDPMLLQMNWQPGTGGGSVADATDCLDRFSDMWTLLAAKMETGVVIAFEPLCEIFDSATGDLTGAVAGTKPSNISGSGGSAILPPQTQGLIRWNTGIIRRGRFLQGRTFVPLPDEGDNTTGGVPGGSYIAQLNFGVAALLAAGTTASAAVVWGRPTTPGGSDGVSGVITSGSGRGTWSVQRKRR